MPGTSFFTWPRPYVREFLGKSVKEIVFIPFAAVTLSFDVYEETVSRAFEAMGYRVRAIHKAGNKKDLVSSAEAIVTGGGNTFALLKRMYDEDLLDVVRSGVSAGTPYIGWSAGANLACPTLKTTNDMPVGMPVSFESLNLVPFQINPHYHEMKFQNQGGETRKERIEEYLLLNPGGKVVGLPEGTLIRREGNNLRVEGEGVAKLYESGKSVMDLRPSTDISFLL